MKNCWKKLKARFWNEAKNRRGYAGFERTRRLRWPRHFGGNLKLLLLMLVLSNAAKLSATNSLNATYNSETVRISQFLCYYEHLRADERETDEMEAKYNLFCDFADSLLEMSRRLGEKISFYSENGIAQLDVGEKRFLFVSGKREAEVKASADEYVLSENYNNPAYIISAACKKLKMKPPKIKRKDRKLYSLETKSALGSALDENEESGWFFFLPGGECHFSPEFELRGNHYIGFYYSENDAMKMKEMIKEKYGADCEIKVFPCDFALINEAYFRIEKN